MKIAKCSHCGAKFDVSKLAVGVKIKCGRCKEVFTVPDMEDAASVAEKKPAPAPAAAASPRTERSGGTRVRDNPSKAAAVRGGTAIRAKQGARTAEDEPPSSKGVRVSRSGVRPAVKKMNPAVLAAAAGGGMLLLAAIAFVVLPGKNPTPANTSPEAAYDTRKAKTNMEDAQAVILLAEWCDQKGLREECDGNVVLAYKLNKDLPDVKTKIQQVLERKAGSLPPEDAASHWNFILWLDQIGMKEEGDRRADYLINHISKNHAEANKRFGRVLFEGKWEDKDLVEAYVTTHEANKNEEEKLAKMTPRQREVYKIVEDQKKRDPDIDFEYLDMGNDEKPYLIFVQKAKRYDAATALSEFSEVLSHLYGLFYEQYGKRFDFADLNQEVMVVWVYDSKETYMKHGGPAIARGHYSLAPNDHMVYTYNESGQRYEVIFHEGVHQLVHRITLKKGGKDGNMFWFTEGIATYFEGFKRDKNLKFILGQVGEWLPGIKMAVRAKAYLPLDQFVSMVYGQAMSFPPQMIGILYCEAWSFMHFLYNYDNQKYRGKFEDYFLKEIGGQGGKATFDAIFPDMKILEAEWTKYVDDLK